MKPFSKSELIGISIILVVLFAITSVNLIASIRRARDAQRRSDLGAITEALEKFQVDFGFFPAAIDGKILTCRDSDFDEIIDRLEKEQEFDRDLFFEALRPCVWGQDSFSNLISGKAEAYMNTIPRDPKAEKGLTYYYFSNTRRYQIYASLEGGIEESGFSEAILGRNLSCGSKLCNFGKSFSETPLDKSIEEYEEELRLKLLEKLGTGND